MQITVSQTIELNGNAGGKRFDGIGIVNGGGATSVLLKDYPQPQRDQILDMVFKPKFGASVSALFVEIPGDGNATQGSMLSHMHTRDDLNYSRGYTWWILSEAKKRNPHLTLDGTAWSGPGWFGNDGSWAEGEFWSQDAADYYLKWLEGLREVYGLEFDAIGCRNEKGESYEFAKRFRKTLNANGFENVKIHAFDHWPDYKFDWVPEMLTDSELCDAVDIIGAHVLERTPAPAEIQQIAEKLNKPIWNTEEHVYKKGFACAIGIVQAFNKSFIHSGATKVVNWYDIAGVYPTEPYCEDPAMLLAHSPWSGHYQVREALWGYAHYGQFTEVGWQYINGGSGELSGGGSFVTLKSPEDDFSIIIETEAAATSQTIKFRIGDGLSDKALCLWRSNDEEQFIRQADIQTVDGEFSLILEPNCIYSLSTTRGQQKGGFADIPAPRPFPFPYYETFEEYTSPEQRGYLPRYTADIAGAFEIAARPDGEGKCLQQVVPIPTISWAPDWMPYTIIGDENWDDYEVSADIYLNADETAGIMGRVNHVGTGYGFVPKGYSLQISDGGECRLVVVRGKAKKQEVVGDAEQQAIIKAQNDAGEGGEKLLGTVQLSTIVLHQWHNLKLRFEGETITALVDENVVLVVNDNLYSQGMAGLLAGQNPQRISTPYFDNLLIKGIGEPLPKPASALQGQTPIYGISEQLPVEFFKNLKAGKKQTVVVYGTSLTHTAQWPKAFESYFDEQFPQQVTLVNAAMSGQHSKWGIANLQERVLSHQPDLVFLEFSINDSATKHGISTEQSANNLDNLVRAIRQQNPSVEIVLQTMNQVWDSPDEPMGKKSASDRPYLTAYYAIYRQYAYENGLPLVDHHLNWLNLRQRDREKFKRMLPDGTHPIPEASLAVTWPAILRLLEKARGAN